MMPTAPLTPTQRLVLELAGKHGGVFFDATGLAQSSPTHFFLTQPGNGATLRSLKQRGLIAEERGSFFKLTADGVDAIRSGK